MRTRGPVVLLACDLPFVEVAVLRVLAGWPGNPTVIPRVDGELQYACARYGPDALERAEVALSRGSRSLRSAAGAERAEPAEHDELAEHDWRVVGPANTFADVDTPADLSRLGLS